MLTRTELLPHAVVIVSALAAATDVARGKIYNWLTLPALAAGLAWSLASDGAAGLGQSALGALVGLVAYGWMFRIGTMGGGDVKLLMALGAWGGPRFAGETALLGVLLGGAMAAVILAAKGRLLALLRKLYRFLLSLFVRELELEAPAIDRKLTMPYGVPIAAAAIWIALDNPFVRWRVWG